MTKYPPVYKHDPNVVQTIIKQPFIARGERDVTGKTPDGIREAMEDLVASYKAWQTTVAPLLRYRTPPEIALNTDFTTDRKLVRFYARGWLDAEDTGGGTLWVELP